MSIFTELKRRNVFRVAAAYLVVGWLFVEIATTLLPTFGAPDWVAKALIVVVALGFFPAVIFSWVYELTPEGLRKESAVDPATSIVHSTGRKLDLITIAAVIAGVGFLGLSHFIAPPRSAGSAPGPTVSDTTDDASVAVLPFVNMSGNPENEYFSDGLTETLLHMLAQVPELKVAARTSSFAFKNDLQDVRKIATTLNVSHVLEGSVQRSGDRVRITAQLIRADDGFHVWSENYDRTLEDIFRVQDEIAAKVGGALTDSLLGEVTETAIASIDTENIGAYDAYLKALGHMATFSYEGLIAAEGELKNALVLDPDFLDAKTELAHVYYLQQNTGLISVTDSSKRSIALLDEVIAERPDDIDAQFLAVLIEANQETMNGNATADLEALPEMLRLIEESPSNVEARLHVARILNLFKRYDEANAQLEAAQKLDSLNPTVYYTIGDAYEGQERYDEAIEALRQSLELEPRQPNVHSTLGNVYKKRGDAVGFVTEYRKAIELDPGDNELPSMLAVYLYQLRLIEDGDSVLRRAGAIAPENPTVRHARLARQFEIGDLAGARESAAEMIRDDLEFRHGSFMYAVWVYSTLSLKDGAGKEAYDFLAEFVPQIHSTESTELPLKVWLSQDLLFPLWDSVLPQDVALAKMDTYIQRNNEQGFGIDDMPGVYIERAVAHGDYKLAADLMLEYDFSAPVADSEGWRHYILTDFMAPAVADPRIQEAVARFEKEEEQVRNELRNYFARTD